MTKKKRRRYSPLSVRPHTLPSNTPQVLDSWDAADDSEEERKKAAKKKAAEEKAAAEAAANKKSTAERIAEKKAATALKKAAEDAEKAAREDETPAEKREREQARELETDMAHAEDLFASVGIGAGSGTSGREKPVAIVDPKDLTKSLDLSALPVFKPTTKAQFDTLRDVLVPLLAANTKKAHYNLFLQDFTRALAKEMPSEQIRTVASKLTVLSNEKQKEEKEAAKGGKKKTVPKKAGLALAGKEMDRVDTNAYDNYYDDL
jgi:translation initiation factor 3 subunit J